ncbi:MAG: X2-like carbohydrate binding domain-containing protein, partial [Oscillospiraceae bacterium]
YNSVKINNCSVIVSTNGSIVDSNVGTSFAGGIIKHMRANTTIENSYVYIQFGGKITANLKNADGIQAGTHVGAGGIAATMPYAANSMTQIKNCYVINEGTIQSRKVDGTPVQGAGGLLGISYSNSTAGDNRGITNSYVYDSGTIQSVDGANQKIADRQGCIYGYHSGANGVPSVSGAYFYSTSTTPAIGAANSTVLPPEGTVGCTLAEMQAGTKLSLLDINVTGSQWKSAADRAPAGDQAPAALRGLPYLLMENNAQFAPASLTYYKGGVDVTTTVTGGGALQSITKDGALVDATNYSFIGSTLTIKKAYLGTLTVGKNVLKLTFAEGQPDRELEIEIVPRSGIDEAKQLIINGTYTFTQAAANTETDVKTALVTQISALPGMTATGVTVVEENITVTDFVAAVAGTAANTNGTNGSFKFTVA